MQLTGMLIGFLDSEPEATEQYSRWFDRDHAPSIRAVPGVLGARRYVATADDKPLRRSVQLMELLGGKGTFCSTYLFGSSKPAEARAAMGTVGSHLADQRRMFPKAQSVYRGSYQLAKSYNREGLSLSPEAIASMTHQGIYIVMGEILDKARTADVEAWYEEAYTPDTLEFPGFAASLRFTSVEPAGQFVQLFFLDKDPVDAVGELRRHVSHKRQRSILAPSGASRTLFSGPYHLAAPGK